MDKVQTESTPVPVIAAISRVVTRVADRITGDRSDYPLLVALGVYEGLKILGVQSRILYGSACWLEVADDHSLIWAGAWDGLLHFWLETEFGEKVDLNLSVAHRKPFSNEFKQKPLYSPPMLWSNEIPGFCKYQPIGVAEFDEPESERDRKWLNTLREELGKNLTEGTLTASDPDFANEPILCSGRSLLDDSFETFKNYDRALGVLGIPESPFDIDSVSTTPSPETRV